MSEAACVRLEELLAERRMLVVIDDAWSAADTRPFLRGGPHCARLLTTRDSATLPRGAAEQPVDQMRDAEAVALLRAGLPDGEDETFSRLAARLGEWPLLLRLANGALVDRVERRRAPLPDALAHVGRLLDKRGLTAFDAKDPRERRDAVGKTLALSLDRLDPAEQARLCELAVFPEDAQVPLGTVELLWQETAGLDDIDTDELLQRLHGLSLLLQLDLDRRFLQLHDVIRAWLRDRLGDGLATVERSLVSAYRSACDGEWHRLDDAYALAYLPMHLRAVDEGAWRSLLLDPQLDGAQARSRRPGRGFVARRLSRQRRRPPLRRRRTSPVGARDQPRPGTTRRATMRPPRRQRDARARRVDGGGPRRRPSRQRSCRAFRP